jgi:hypothetical protein
MIVILSDHFLFVASTEGASALQVLQPGAQNQKATGLPSSDAVLTCEPPTIAAVKLSNAVACDAAAGCVWDVLFAAEMAGTEALAPDAAVSPGLVLAGLAEPQAVATTTRLASARRATVRRRDD